MQLPTQEQCLELFEQYKVPRNIKEHCLSVQKIAFFLAKKLKEAGTEINLELVSKTALLHDLFKVVAIKELKPDPRYMNYYSDDELAMWQYLQEKYAGMHECEVAYLIFKEDYPELAKSIRDASSPFKEDKILEEDLVHYADWRIFNNQVVNINLRLNDLKVRYTWEEEYWKKRKELMLKVEAELFFNLDFTPEQLKERFEEDGQ
ncbi:MAG: HD domain-containing protein [Nanoarchaeota archaeon]|nr:HD domain-containing protein [Nanoarchaeota archaeon]MBU1622369.1 HD domain-containing protein [Nanoarchaeota archaeon]